MKMQMPKGESYSKVKNTVKKYNLHTICTSGNCPNIGDCWNRGTATFMILGEICTRSCKFCGVKTGKPLPVDWDEPNRIAESVKLMNVKHCVITSVDRDDLEDGGSEFWSATIKKIKEINPSTTIETLIPDFDNVKEDIQKVIDAKPEVISHNLETVPRLTPQIRSRAQYNRSLQVLKQIAESGVVAKSGIMLGLGEKHEEILQVMDDLLAVGCKVMTIGQYLAPSSNHLPVEEYVTPEKFEEYKTIGLEKGFKFVESSPLVRSSYRAENHICSH
ncbi:MAG: lipoyl synthase [Bacteroidales bacterium]|nr:lipoyl synthase [Bacteroidales bacterium]